MKFFKFLISRVLLLNIIMAIVLSLGIVIGVDRLLKIYTLQEQKIEVPNLKGLTEKEAKVVLNDLKLTYELLEIGSYNPEISKNGVLDQQPAAGKIVKEKRKIYITLNPGGYASVQIPEFYGKTKKEIVQLISNSGFKIGEYVEIDDIGTVVRGLKYQGGELKLGDKLPKNSYVDVVIGNGLLEQ